LISEQIEKTFSIAELEVGLYSYKVVEENGKMTDAGQFIVTK
jgi:hypothetical protein